MKKKMYKILQPEIHYVYWEVEADSEEDALMLMEEGEAMFLDEADDVEPHGDPEIVEVYDIDE